MKNPALCVQATNSKSPPVVLQKKEAAADISMEAKPTEQRSSDLKPIEHRPLDNRLLEARPTQPKSPKQKLMDDKLTETRPLQSNYENSRPVEPKPAQLGQTETKSTELKPVGSLRKPTEHKSTEQDFNSTEDGQTDAHQQQQNNINTPRLTKSGLRDRAQSARRESGTMKEYSRRRFQTVVDLESQSSPRPLSPPHTPKLRSASTRPGTTVWGRGETAKHLALTTTTTINNNNNGPTKDGSILYNGKPWLLSSIRTRPKSEPPSKFDHLRGTNAAYPDIQRTLEQSNCEYRVGISPCTTARKAHSYITEEPSVSADFVILIPVTSQASDVTYDDDGSVKSAEWKEGPVWFEEQMLLTSTARSRSPKSSSTPKRSGLEKLDGSVPVETSGKEGELLDINRNNVHCTPGQPSPAIPRVNLQADITAGEEDNTTKDTDPSSQPSRGTPRNKAPQPKNAPGLLSVPGTTKRPSSSSKKRASSSRPSSARSDTSSVVSFSPRPRCWVDDVTISSDDSLEEREQALREDLDDKVSVYSGEGRGNKSQVQGRLSPNQVQRGNSPAGGMEKKKVTAISKRINSSILKRSPSAVKANRQIAKQSVASGSKVGVKMAAAGQEAGGSAVVLADGGRKAEVTLPRFVCPSSESKSRQAAIKEWLANTSFSAACRTVPLV